MTQTQLKTLSQRLIELLEKAPKGEHDRLIKQFVYELGLSGKSALFRKLLTHIDHMMQKKEDMKRIIIETADEWNQKSQEQAKEFFSKNFSGSFQIEFITRKELIAGIRIKSGDTLVDATLKNRLQQLKLKMRQ